MSRNEGKTAQSKRAAAPEADNSAIKNPEGESSARGKKEKKKYS